MADHYEVLELTKTATPDQIRKNYKKLAVKWHPDKNPLNQEEATEKFKLVAEAYAVLSDPQKKTEYDNRNNETTFGEPSAFRQQRRTESSRPRRSHFTEQHAFDIFNSFFAEMEAMHQQMFEDPFGDPFFTGFGNSRFGMGGPVNRTSNQRNEIRDPFARHSALMSNFFGHDPFGSAEDDFGFGRGFGGGFGHGFGGGVGFPESNFGRGSSMLQSSSFSSSGGRGTSKSVSSSTSIGPDGRRITKSTTTIVHPDGRRETSTEEFVDGVPISNRIGNGSAAATGGVSIPIHRVSHGQPRNNFGDVSRFSSGGPARHHSSHLHSSLPHGFEMYS